MSATQTIVESVTAQKPQSDSSYISRGGEAQEPQNDSSYIPRGDVTASLNFFEPPADGSIPYNWVEEQTDGRPQSNYGQETKTVSIRDIRGKESAFNLDKDAFQLLSGVSSAMSEEDWWNDDTIRSVYYPEVVKLILDTFPGTHKVTFFDHTVRRAGNKAARDPVFRVHVDQTGRAAETRVRLHDPEDAESLLKGRYRIINVWRPLNGPIQGNPLVFASADTVDREDLKPVELRYPTRTGETASVKYNPDQKFYYWPGMDNDERIFLKCWDSQDGVGKSVPHSSFVDERTPKGAKGRESIEVRALVYG